MRRRPGPARSGFSGRPPARPPADEEGRAQEAGRALQGRGRGTLKANPGPEGQGVRVCEQAERPLCVVPEPGAHPAPGDPETLGLRKGVCVLCSRREDKECPEHALCTKQIAQKIGSFSQKLLLSICSVGGELVLFPLSFP